MTLNHQVFCRRCGRQIADFSALVLYRGTISDLGLPKVQFTDACALCDREPSTSAKPSAKQS